MCGIAGIVGPESRGDTIDAMTAALRHRGPDDAGTWRDDAVALGHTRLAILDLTAAGHQPMALGPYTIVYNGEIYNFAELGRELGAPLKTRTDTEVLLHAWAREGPRCLERLQGMFAFALWDARDRTLHLVRDRLGIKPLCYRDAPESFAFASEIKALLPLADRAVDRSALSDFFTYKYVPSPKTIYREIRKLPPGHRLEWRDGRVRVERWWTPVAGTTESDAGRAQERLGGLLGEIVPAHTLADVPVGVFLSGGLDSTALVANLDRPRTFTVGFRGSDRSEADHARATAAHFGTTHQERLVTGLDLDAALDAMPDMIDEPFGDSATWSTFVVSREARRDVTVALSGEGGDELFSGYERYRKQSRYRSSAWARTLVRMLPPFGDTALSFHRRAATGLERYAALVGPFHPAQKRALLDPALVARDYDDLWALRAFWREDLDPVKRLQWLDLHTYLPDDLLVKADRASMAVSLELRPPLLDHRLVEFALTLDGALLTDGERGKLPVREFLRGRVPGDVLDRPKRGFSMPVRRWSRSRPDLLRDACARLARAGVLRRATPPPLHSEQVWSLLVLDRWITRARPSL